MEIFFLFLFSGADNGGLLNSPTAGEDGGGGVGGGDGSVADEGDDRSKKRPRTAFTASQITALETEFERNKYLSVSKRMQLSKQLKLTETQVRGGV